MKKMNIKALWKNKIVSVFLVLSLCAGLAGCGSKSDQADTSVNKEQLSESTSSANAEEEKTAVDKDFDTNISSELTYDHRLDLKYASQFSVDYYEDGYRLLTVYQDGQYLIVPEGKEAPDDLADDITVVAQPKSNIYMVGSATMDFFVALDALDTLTFSALQEKDWYIDAAKEQMKAGKLTYAGKYSAPDYELILSKGCSLAIENTMIYHNPEVKEKLESFDIPVMVDYSSYESEPMGRVEWVKFYGALLGMDDQAEDAFNEQLKEYKEVADQEDTGKTVAFFYITSNGAVSVRKSTDYLPKMITQAGGEYIFKDLGAEDDNASSSTTLQMEEFYAEAKDADYIIYNSSIEGELSSVDDLIAQSELLKNFKAVQDGNVYCTSKNLYQSTMEIGSMIKDFSNMLHGNDDNLKYMYKLN